MAPVVFNVGTATDSRDVVHRAVQALTEGKLVVLPTETVYGIAASALHEEAVNRLAEVKQRPADEALALAVKSAEEAFDYVPQTNLMGRRLARRCWPGPVTLVLPDNHPESLIRQLPESVRKRVSPQGTVGLRVPGHSLVLDVLRLLQGPLVLSSANRAGQANSVTADEALASLQDDVDLILDDGRCQYAQPSSVVQVDGSNLNVLREGVVSAATIDRFASFMVLLVCTGNTCRSPMAEALCRNQLAKHQGCSIEELESRSILVASAGIAAGTGGRPTPEAVQVMSDRGLDLAGHLTQPLSDRLVRYADVILTMTNQHREIIVRNWPEAAERTHVLCADRTDVADPIGGPQELYHRCAEQIDRALQVRVNEFELPDSKSRN